MPARSRESSSDSEAQSAEDEAEEEGASSDTEVGEAAPFFFRVQPKLVRRNFRVYKWPILLSVLAELAFCGSVSGWVDANRERLGEAYYRSEHQCNLSVRRAWLTFAICLLARMLSVLSWKCRFCGFHDNTFAATYLLFSTGQWLVYMMSYYTVVDGLMSLQWKPMVQVQNNNTDLSQFLAEFDETASMRDCLKRHASTTCMLVVSYNQRCRKARDPVHCATDMKTCLEEHPPTVCTELINQKLRCKTPYDPYTCSGSVHLVSAGGTTVNCCVRNLYSLHVPVQEVPFVGWQMTDVLEVLKWASVLAIQWSLKDMPMLPTAASSELSDGCWLDILDAVVFSKYLTVPIVTYPRYGIEPPGHPNEGYAGIQDRTVYDTLLRTWIFGLGATLLSPVLYTLLKPRGGDDYDEMRDIDEPGVEDAIQELLESIALLDEERALELTKESIRRQRKGYVARAATGEDEWYHVTVHTKGLMSRLRRTGRSGLARMTRPGFYEVRYTDGKMPAEASDVPVKRLQLHVVRKARFNCSGWCKFGLLMCGKGKTSERYEARARVLDAMRSLLLLEGPFLVWRWWLDVSQLTSSLRLFGPGMFLMLKNLVWGVHDLFIILSCGNDSATILGVQPVSVLRQLTSGTVLGTVRVMPVGVFNVASAVLTKRAAHNIQARREALNIQKAWLIVEREKAISDGTLESTSQYSAALDATNAKLKALDIKEKLNHV